MAAHEAMALQESMIRPRFSIDVIVPVYNAVHDLRRCVESVLKHTGGDYRLVLIDDASPDDSLRKYFDELKDLQLAHVELLANATNLGFTLTANRGMACARPSADVVLLNSDTIVTHDWLDALARCAASDARIGTITPFSNNAEICSLPRFCENNAWPPDRDASLMGQALRETAVPTYPDIPTGVGFCLYIRRALIDAIGAFDPAFGQGYGEENDFCMRAADAGFRNVLCDDAFVVHSGGSSFGDARTELAQRNMALLLSRHPRYLDLVGEYIDADPLRPLRVLSAARYRSLVEPLPGMLHVIHGHGGGTEYHVRALIASACKVFYQYLLIAVGDEWQLESHTADGIETYDFRRLPDESWSDFLGGLCARFGIELIHLHNISGCRDGLMSSLSESRVPYGYTVHDLNFACPTITFLNEKQAYCGGVTDSAVCRHCLALQPEFKHVDIESWRERHRALLARAAFIIAPSPWAGSMLRRYFPEHEIEIIPHASSEGMQRDDAVKSRLPCPDDGRPVVAVLGAIGPDKGSRRLESLVALTRARALNLRWVLIGYLDRGRVPLQSEDGVFTMHGPYDSRELAALLEHYKVRLVAYPSAGPETFSFTLSEAWAAGLPAVVPPIGALAERVRATGAGWIFDESEWPSEARMLDRIVSLLDEKHRGEYDAAAARARAGPQSTLESMVSETLAVYRRAKTDASIERSMSPIAIERCLAALHYAPWIMPDPKAIAEDESSLDAAPAASSDVVARFAQAALRIRHTLPGRMLYRIAPKSVVAALKARLAP